MAKYSLNKEEFFIEDYNKAKSFCSFLPAISGKFGLPLWCFYVNRAQGVVSLGIKDKDHSLLEFLPANKSLFSVFYQGFRTFLKIDSKFYEPFRIPQKNQVRQVMKVSSSFLEIEEENKKRGLDIRVRYFTLPSSEFASLVRIVELKNITTRPRDLEIIDGLPGILPYGCKNLFLKDLARTLEAWMQSYLNKDLAFFKLKVSPQDIAQTIYIQGVNFYFSCFFSKKNEIKFLRPIIDSHLLFGEDSDLSLPFNFADKKFNYVKKDLLLGRTPCAFSFVKLRLNPQESFRFFSFIGSAEREEEVVNFSKKLSLSWIEDKFEENKKIIKEIQQKAFINSSLKTLDFYTQQNFLDNVLRGGFPQRFGDKVFYLYNRKHGDLERDYNRFKFEHNFLSSGEGNYRDINQNRRQDVFFEPKVFEENIRLFFNLQRLDSYNPLVVKSPKFIFRDKESFKKAFFEFFVSELLKKLEGMVFSEFSLSEFMRFLKENKVSSKLWEELIKRVLSFSKKVEQADFGEGFWIDHFTYNLDLVESFLAVFPDKESELLFKEEYSFYDDFCKLTPRRKRYYLKDGYILQKDFLGFDGEKANLINSRQYFKHQLRIRDKDEVFYTNLLVKLLVVVLNRISTLDPFGRGVEMEAGKPGWCDALNGLPSLLGSSLAETFELLRIILFLKEKVGKYREKKISLPSEIFNFFKDLKELLQESKSEGFKDSLDFWERSHTLKEDFREKVFWGVSSEFYSLSLGEVEEFLELSEEKISLGLKDIDYKRLPTYFINEVVEYQEKQGFIFPLKFKQKELPIFLEGFVRAMKISPPETIKLIYNSLKKSSLYDKNLKMYKICTSLRKAPLEIGRIKVFPPGWLENESIWVHMEYKYLLELIKAGLYEEFYKEFFNCFICFLKPSIYGRSNLENSSFIVSSANPDKKLWGRGFVARLTGATSEALNILLFMCLGKNPFYLKQGKLILEFKPLLKKDLFTKKEDAVFILDNKGKPQEFTLPKNTFSFMFLGKTLVIYHNPQRIDTYNRKAKVEKIIVRYANQEEFVFNSSQIEEPHSLRIRDQKAWIIEVFITSG